MRLRQDRQEAPKMDLLIYLPNNAAKAGAGVPGPELRRQPRGPHRPGHHALPRAGCAEQGPPGSRATEESRGTEAAAGRSRRSSPAATAWPRSTTATSTRTSTTASRTACTRCSTSRARRSPAPDEWGVDRRLGLGPEPRAGLPGDRPGRRRQARGRDRPLAAGQDGAVGRRAGRALRPGDLATTPAAAARR